MQECSCPLRLPSQGRQCSWPLPPVSSVTLGVSCKLLGAGAAVLLPLASVIIGLPVHLASQTAGLAMSVLGAVCSELIRVIRPQYSLTHVRLQGAFLASSDQKIA